MRVRGYVSTVWGCPYEGDVDPKRALAIARKLIAMGCYQISLGDTIGVGTPLQTQEIVRTHARRNSRRGASRCTCTTRAARRSRTSSSGLEMGVRDFDASVGGLGGCPYAPGAAGNVATEDLVYMLHGMGIATGIDLERLVEAGKAAEGVVGRPLPGKVHQAGVRSLRA